MDFEGFEARKRDHIRLALDATNEALGGAGFDRIQLSHRALPELDFQSVSITSTFWKYAAASPCFISSMTMGHGEGESLNTLLAKVASEKKWPMGVGSQRRELEDETAAHEAERLRKNAPNACFFSNIGLAQIIGTPTKNIRRLVDSLGASALIVHCNSLQEALQPEGTPNFAGGNAALANLCEELDLPVIVKETGCGISPEDFCLLAETGVAAIDVSGYGGTHWGRIEGGRAGKDLMRQEAAKTFAFWGEPTVDSLLSARECALSEAKKSLREKESGKSATAIWASGGIRSGLDVAKCVALGAEKVGFAKPALEAAGIGEGALASWMERIEFELKVALFCTGSANLEALAKGGKWRKI